jgi:hypothetical protein
VRFQEYPAFEPTQQTLDENQARPTTSYGYAVGNGAFAPVTPPKSRLGSSGRTRVNSGRTAASSSPSKEGRLPSSRGEKQQLKSEFESEGKEERRKRKDKEKSLKKKKSRGRRCFIM